FRCRTSPISQQLRIGFWSTPGLRPGSVTSGLLPLIPWLRPGSVNRDVQPPRLSDVCSRDLAHVEASRCVDAATASDVRSAVASACRVTGVRVFRDAVLANQVHLVVSFRPDIRLSDFVRLAKSVAATRANRRVTGTVRWARGYFVTTIHKRDLSRATRYVADQFQRHPDLLPRKSRRP